MINVEIKKKEGETTGSLLRRFTKKVQSAGVLSRVRSIRYNERPLNNTKVKKRKLTQIARNKERDHLIKMGKAPLQREKHF